MASWTSALSDEGGSIGFLRRLAAFTLILLSGWLLVYHIFPLYETVFPITRDISTIAQGALFALIAIVALRQPKLFRMEPLTVGAIALVVAGAALAYLGTMESSRSIMVLSSTLLRTGMAWLHIVVGVSLTGLGARQLAICVVLGTLFSYLLQYLFFLFPSVTGVAAFVAIPFVCYLLVAPYARFAFESLASAKPPFVSSITQPSSFLPFFHQMFLSILVFRIVCGFELSFGEVGGTPLKTFLFPVATLALALVIIVFRWRIRTDPLFEASALLIMAGLLFVPLATAVSAQPLVSIILSSGRTFFDFLFWFLLVAIASRNPHGAVTVFAWGNALSCFGLVIGAFLGRLTNEYATMEPMMTIVVTGTILWCFVAYILILLRRFSFDAAILAIVPEAEPVLPATVAGALDSLSERLAAKFGLTAREAEVLALLVRGRSGHSIAEILGVSHNTVKAHVKHIYRKLDIHTHQELLDLLGVPNA